MEESKELERDSVFYNQINMFNLKVLRNTIYIVQNITEGKALGVV